MSLDHLFPWLVEAHYHNLDAHLKYLEEGGRRVHEGEEHPSEEVTGVLIIGNGRLVSQKLRQDGIIKDRLDPTFVPAGTRDEFTGVLSSMRYRDGALVYNGSDRLAARVAKVGNTSAVMDAIRHDFPKLVPSDLVFRGARELTDQVIDDYVGTKTDLAIVVPPTYSTPDHEVHGFIIKRTAYGNVGTGPVLHAGPRGLVERFYFDVQDGRLVAATERFVPTGEGVVLHQKGVEPLPRRYQDAFDRINGIPELRGQEQPPVLYRAVG
ncbi:hypothetical protein HYS47_02580 [Candidatus Woesearchaeota archaeon]|nr:hypothetical protein [Candidatus Woesearchaeota archaeon]